MSRAAFFWTEDATDRACALSAQGWSSGHVARELGMSRNAVIGRFKRLRDLGDPRAPALKESAATRAIDVAGLRPIDALAESMAEGCASLEAAAKRLRLPISETRRLWLRICARLGAQAA